MTKRRIFAFFLIAASLIWFFTGISFIVYSLLTGVNFLLVWIILFGIPCFLVWYISYRFLKKSSGVKNLSASQPYNQYSSQPYSSTQEMPDAGDGFRFDFISYKKEGQLQWNFLFSDSGVLQNIIHLDEKVDLLASAIEINGSTVVEMSYQIDGGNSIRMYVTKVDDRDPIEKNIIPQGWKASLDPTKISKGEHEIVFKAVDSQGRCIEKSIKFFKEDVRIVKLKKQRKFEKFTMTDEIGGGIIIIVIGIVGFFVMRMLYYPLRGAFLWFILLGILLLFGGPYHAIKAYKLKRQIKKLK